jgi:hypothetical protein
MAAGMRNLQCSITDGGFEKVKAAAKARGMTLRAYILSCLGIDEPGRRSTLGKTYKKRGTASSAESRTLTLPHVSPEPRALSETDQILFDAGVLEPDAIFGGKK